MQHDFTKISYVIDANNRLVSVSPEWKEFALSIGGVDLSSEHVIGRSLWDFVGDDPTRELYEAVLEHVRLISTTTFVLRCDCPESRRLVEMTVSLLPTGNIEFKSTLLTSKPRAAERLFANSTSRNGRQVMVCSWCNKVNVDLEKWFEVESAMEYLQLTEDHELPRIESVVCPACYAKVMETISSSHPLEDVHLPA